MIRYGFSVNLGFAWRGVWVRHARAGTRLDCEYVDLDVGCVERTPLYWLPSSIQLSACSGERGS